MYSQEEVLKKMNELAKLYMECLKRSRFTADEKKGKKDDYDNVIKDIYKVVSVKKVGTKDKVLYNKSNGNRLCAKKFFLTIPKNSMPKKDLLEYYLNHKSMNIVKAAVCEEKHKDGTDHRHVFLEFSAKKDIKRKDFFNLDDKYKKYGNISVKVDTIKKGTKENIYSYMCKTDKNVYSYGFNIRMDSYGKLKPKEVWYKYAIGEWDMGDVVKYDPSYLTKNISKLHDRVDDNLKYLKKYFSVDFVF
jgi:hypothetical protein